MLVQGDDGMLRSGLDQIAGVDEAGRGPLAGPVYAACVILHDLDGLEGLNDSKKITAKKRSLLFELIKEKAYFWSIASASVAEIDALNILQATLLAMKRAIEQLPAGSYTVCIDGNQAPSNLRYPVQTIVGGDALEPSIIAASILAKVARDEVMLRLADVHPDYGFERHKGYGTKTHMAALTRFGPIDGVHRDFEPVRRLRALQPCLD